MHVSPCLSTCVRAPLARSTTLCADAHCLKMKRFHCAFIVMVFLCVNLCLQGSTSLAPCWHKNKHVVDLYCKSFSVVLVLPQSDKTSFWISLRTPCVYANSTRLYQWQHFLFACIIACWNHSLETWQSCLASTFSLKVAFHSWKDGSFYINELIGNWC